MGHRLFTFVVGCVVAVSVGAVAVQVVAPSAAGSIEAFIREHAIGWDHESCRAAPADCLRSKYQSLADRERKVDDTIRLLQSEGARLGGVIVERAFLIDKNRALLEQGRTVLADAEAKDKTAVLFAGRTYPDTATFRRQLLVLFAEQDNLGKAVADARALESQLNGQTQELVIQRSNVRAARELIPAKLALVQGSQVFGEFDESIAMIDDAISTTDSGLLDAGGLIGSTQELIASEAGSRNSAEGGSDVNQSFEDFLKGGLSANS